MVLTKEVLFLLARVFFKGNSVQRERDHLNTHTTNTRETKFDKHDLK